MVGMDGVINPVGCAFHQCRMALMLGYARTLPHVPAMVSQNDQKQDEQHQQHNENQNHKSS